MTSVNNRQVLLDAYGIDALAIHPVPAGFSAKAYRVQGRTGDFFLKIYDRCDPSTRQWVERIGQVLPVVHWLQGQEGLGDCLCVPIRAQDGSFYCSQGRYIYLVYPFIEGRTIGDEPLEPARIRELARIVGRLHRQDAGMTVSASLRETFAVPLIASLPDRLGPMISSDLRSILEPHEAVIRQSCSTILTLSGTLAGSGLPFVWCHGALHGWNLIQARNLVLVDWETLILAPAEADLCSFSQGFFFGYGWNEALAAYRSVCPFGEVNRDALLFYRLKRVLEDIALFGESLLDGKLDPERRAWTSRCLEFVCRQLGGVDVM